MTTDDPQRQTAVAEDRGAGGPSAERAELLGTTALTARVRCPCGRRQDVEREDWRWDGGALCTACGRGLLHDSLRVVGRREALSIIEGRRPTEGELRALRRLELALREFVLRYDGGLRWHWAPANESVADEVGRLLTELDRSRRERGAPPVGAVGRASLDETGAAETGADVAGEEEWAEERGEGEEDLPDEEGE